MEILFISLAFGVLCAVIANGKGRSGFGWFVLGCLLSLIALIIILLLPSLAPGDAAPTPETHVKCPDCRELVLMDARVCKHCGCRLQPATGETETKV